LSQVTAIPQAQHHLEATTTTTTTTTTTHHLNLKVCVFTDAHFSLPPNNYHHSNPYITLY
jgi:hypothetical protein